MICTHTINTIIADHLTVLWEVNYHGFVDLHDRPCLVSTMNDPYRNMKVELPYIKRMGEVWCNF